MKSKTFSHVEISPISMGLTSQKRKQSALSVITKKILPFTSRMITSFATTAKRKETFST
jgi:hypothetical protein